MYCNCLLGERKLNVCRSHNYIYVCVTDKTRLNILKTLFISIKLYLLLKTMLLSL